MCRVRAPGGARGYRFGHSKATNLIAHLTEEQMDVTELEEVLIEIFEENVNVLQSKDLAIRTNIRRLIGYMIS